MDLNRLTLGDKIMGVSGILLFIFSFFKWLGYDYGPFSVSASAWSFTLCWLAVILGVLCVAYVVLKALDVKLPDLGSVSWGQVILVIAALAFLLILIKLIAGPSTGGVDISGTGISKSRKIGIFLGLISSAGLVAGAFLNARDSGELPGSLGGKKRGDATPPPPTA
jgi:hypothetical protein